VARAGIQDQVDGLERERGAGAIGHPGVFANLEAEADAADIEEDIAEGIAHVVDDQGLLGPRATV
jgi:hypothetical protein